MQRPSIASKRVNERRLVLGALIIVLIAISAVGLATFDVADLPYTSESTVTRQAAPPNYASPRLGEGRIEGAPAGPAVAAPRVNSIDRMIFLEKNLWLPGTSPVQGQNILERMRLLEQNIWESETWGGGPHTFGGGADPHPRIGFTQNENGSVGGREITPPVHGAGGPRMVE